MDDRTEPKIPKFRCFGIIGSVRIGSVKFRNTEPKLLEVLEQIWAHFIFSTFKSSYWEAFSKSFKHFLGHLMKFFGKSSNFQNLKLWKKNSIFWKPKSLKFLKLAYKNAVKCFGGSSFEDKTDKFENIKNCVSVRYYRFRFGKLNRNFGFGNFGIYPFRSTTDHIALILFSFGAYQWCILAS